MCGEFIKTNKKKWIILEGDQDTSIIAQNGVRKCPVMDDTYAWRLAFFEQLSGSIAEDIL